MRRETGFTLVELLVASAVLLVLVALAARPMIELSRRARASRDEAEAIERYIRFVRMLEADARRSPVAHSTGPGALRLVGGDGDSIVWTVSPTQARRDSRSGSLKLSIDCDTVAFDTAGFLETPPRVRLRGRFRGVGDVTREFGSRLE